MNSKNRKLKYRINLILHKFSFNFLNLTGSKRIALLGSLISILTLFFPWFSYRFSTNAYETRSSFSIGSGYVGYILIFVHLFVIFIILSSKSKERLKSKANIIFHDYTLIIFAGILAFLLTIVVYNSIRGLIAFTGDVKIGSGIIFELIGSLFVLAGGLLNYREKKKEVLSKVYIENSKFEANSDLEEYKDILNSGQNQSDVNMKLPI